MWKTGIPCDLRDTEPLLGTTALESVVIEVNPTNGELLQRSG